MFKKNKRKYIHLGYVKDRIKEQEEREQKPKECNITFDGEKFYKAFNKLKY